AVETKPPHSRAREQIDRAPTFMALQIVAQLAPFARPVMRTRHPLEAIHLERARSAAEFNPRNSDKAANLIEIALRTRLEVVIKQRQHSLAPEGGAPLTQPLAVIEAGRRV